MSLFAELAAALPTKREVHPAGWPRPVYVHRLQLEGIVALATVQPSDQESDSDGDNLDWLVQIVSRSLGDEAGPRDFDSDDARAWLRSHPQALQELAAAAIELNELGEAHPERKKG